MNNKKFITYLFGAGASAQAIPVASHLKKRLKDLKVYLQANFITINEGALSRLNHILRENQSAMQDFISDLDWLITVTENYDTIDVYAKYLYDHEDSLLNRLKMVLVFYFYFEQIVTFPSTISNEETEKYKNRLDSRYYNLLSQIAEGKNGEIEFGEKIKLLTWNYDMQIDMSIMKYTRNDIQTVKRKYHIYPNNNSYNDNEKFNLNTNKFCTIKLNGNAFFDNLGYNDLSKSHLLYDMESEDLQSKIATALLAYISMFSENTNRSSDNFKFFNFSWEKNGKYTGFERTFNHVREIAKQTKILVISGYSFPIFNSLIDMQILAEMWPLEIHIQDANPSKIEKRIRDLMPKFNHVGDKTYPKIEFKYYDINEQFPFPSIHYHDI